MAVRPMTVARLNLGLNLRGMTAGINTRPGQAQDAVDVLPREDGPIYSHWGHIRRNPTALNGTIVGAELFTYKGKNVNVAGGNTAREGNFGVADDAGLAIHSRRQALYTGAIILTTTTFYFWDNATEAFIAEGLPGGVAINVAPKPAFVAVNHNIYIFGWADSNLRYDPTDRALYELGWEAAPVVIPGGNAVLAAGGDLVADAPYQYSYAFFDLLTGEMSNMSPPVTVTPTGANLSVQFTAGAFVDYAGARHWDENAAEVRPTDRDVGAVLFRTAPYGEAFFFLTIINPRLGVAAFLDQNLNTAKGQKALRSEIDDEPTFNAAHLWRDIIYALSWEDSTTNVYFNNWNGSNSYHERWDVRDRSALPTRQGEALTAIAHTENFLLVLSRQRGFLGTITMSSRGKINARWHQLQWTVGAVGPAAICEAGPWIYFLSERGPYRWREGLAEPQWIGRDLLALFIDPTSGLCKLNAEAKIKSELIYDLDANVVRWSFAVGRSAIPNMHLIYWLHDDIEGMEPAAGWFFCSTRPQAMSYGNALSGVNTDGTPPDPFVRKSRLVFGDPQGYVNEYEVGHRRAGLLPGAIARGISTDTLTSTVNLLDTNGGLYDTGDGMAGMRLEVIHLDGTIDVRRVATNDDTQIVPDQAFSQVPGDFVQWYVGGVPAMWRSVPESYGDPFMNKSVVDYGVKLIATRPYAGQEVFDLSLAVGDFPVAYSKTDEVDVALYHAKRQGSSSGRFAQIEFANTRPDEFFAITAYSMWVKGAETRNDDEVAT